MGAPAYDWSRHDRLPDETPVRVFPQLGESYPSTVAEVCNSWRDARLFGFDYALRTRGEWRSLGLTIRMEAQP